MKKLISIDGIDRTGKSFVLKQLQNLMSNEELEATIVEFPTKKFRKKSIWKEVSDKSITKDFTFINKFISSVMDDYLTEISEFVSNPSSKEVLLMSRGILSTVVYQFHMLLKYHNKEFQDDDFKKWTEYIEAIYNDKIRQFKLENIKIKYFLLTQQIMLPIEEKEGESVVVRNEDATDKEFEDDRKKNIEKGYRALCNINLKLMGDFSLHPVFSNDNTTYSQPITSYYLADINCANIISYILNNI